MARTDGWTKKQNQNNKNALCSNPPRATRKTVPGAVTTGADRESRHSAAVCKLMIDTYSSFADDEERIPSSTLSDDVIALIVERL